MIDDPVVLLLVVAAISFIGAAITAALAVGGGLLLLAVFGLLLPPAALIPVHGAVMGGLNGGRAVLFRRAVDRASVRAFVVGAVLGAALGGRIVVALPPDLLRLAVAAFILFTQWGPALRLPQGGGGIGVAGFVSTVLTLFVGASGPFVTAALSRLGSLDRWGLVGTAAACMTLQHLLKVVVFAAGGFVFADWAGVIAVGVGAGFAGTLVGRQLLARLDERAFRSGLRGVLTALAVFLAGLGIRGLIGA